MSITLSREQQLGETQEKSPQIPAPVNEGMRVSASVAASFWGLLLGIIEFMELLIQFCKPVSLISQKLYRLFAII